MAVVDGVDVVVDQHHHFLFINIGLPICLLSLSDSEHANVDKSSQYASFWLVESCSFLVTEGTYCKRSSADSSRSKGSLSAISERMFKIESNLIMSVIRDCL